LPRDDEYISQLLYFVGILYERYVCQGCDLHSDFFLEPLPAEMTMSMGRRHKRVLSSSSSSSSSSSGVGDHADLVAAYDALLKATLKLSKSAEIVARIPNEQIQRHPWSSPSFFLQQHHTNHKAG